MLKILLKHVIYEVCIYNIFSGIFNNFVKPKKDDIFSLIIKGGNVRMGTTTPKTKLDILVGTTAVAKNFFYEQLN